MILSGSELVKTIRIEQADRAAALLAEHSIMPKLVIIRDSDNPVINKYVQMKINYGESIGVEVENRLVSTEHLVAEIDRANNEDTVHGIIVQLPIQASKEETETIVGHIKPAKDVDGLTGKGEFHSATAGAIDQLIRGYNIDLSKRRIAIIGYGKLVGEPLTQMWRDRGLTVEMFRKSDGRDISQYLHDYDLIVTATGVPELIKSDMISPGTVLVDAGTASEKGVIVGDVEEALRQRDDIDITPKIGGVGPLTVSTLFSNVLQSTENSVK